MISINLDKIFWWIGLGTTVFVSLVVGLCLAGMFVAFVRGLMSVSKQRSKQNAVQKRD